jgi:hypothetical protein
MYKKNETRASMIGYLHGVCAIFPHPNALREKHIHATSSYGVIYCNITNFVRYGVKFLSGYHY